MAEPLPAKAGMAHAPARRLDFVSDRKYPGSRLRVPVTRVMKPRRRQFSQEGMKGTFMRILPAVFVAASITT